MQKALYICLRKWLKISTLNCHEKLLQAFHFDHKAYAHHHNLKAKANQNKPCSASQSSYPMDKTKKKKRKKSNTEREDRRHYREKKGKIFKNRKNAYL